MGESTTSAAPQAQGPRREFWEERFRARQTPWERGAVHPQLLRWLADDSRLSPAALGGAIAVPGCGSGEEVATLAGRGFDVVAIDYAAEAIALTRKRLDAAASDARLVQHDVLSWQPDAPLAAAGRAAFRACHAGAARRCCAGLCRGPPLSLPYPCDASAVSGTAVGLAQAALR